MIVKVFFSNSFLFFLLDFSMVFRRFLREFPIFLETGFSAEIPIKRDRTLCKNNSVLSVESVKLMTTIEAKMDKT